MRRRTLTTLAAAAALAVGAGGLATAVAQSSSTTLRARGGDHAFQVVMVPAAPSVGHRVMIQLDLAQIPTVPDPTYGDRIPVKDASLVALVSPESSPKEKIRFSMHPLGAAGRYGFHWTPATKGLHELTFERRGGELPAVTFKIGVDVETPKQNDMGQGATNGPLSRGLPRQRLERPGVTTRGPVTPIAAGPTAQTIMEAMDEPAGLVAESLTAEKPLASPVQENLALLVAQANKLPGTVPDKYRVAASEYDAMAKDLQARLAHLDATAKAGDMAKVRTEWTSVVNESCTRCHVKFWWAITPDLEAWPKVSARPWKR